jgi:hypothetical protein
MATSNAIIPANLKPLPLTVFPFFAYNILGMINSLFNSALQKSILKNIVSKLETST